MRTTINKLSHLNIQAIQETIPVDLGVTTTATTATFDMDAASALHLVMVTISRLNGRGHPKASLHAVKRRLQAILDEGDRAAIADVTGAVGGTFLDKKPPVCLNADSSDEPREVRMTDTQQSSSPTFDPAALFLLDLSHDQLFEPVASTGKYRCKGCRQIINGGDRAEHHANHRRDSATTKKESNNMATDKPKKQTAKDLGVPAAYLADNGNFRPGMDARLKSDLILAILEMPNPKALVQFSKADATKLFAKYPHWAAFLDRKREILDAAAKKVAEKAEERKQRETAKAANKRSGSTGGKNIKSTEQIVAEEQAAHDAAQSKPAAGEAKPDPKPTRKPRAATAKRRSARK